MNKKNKSIFDDKRVVLAVAVVLAVIAWVIIAGFIIDSKTQTFTGVTVNYRQNESTYKNLDLAIVNEPRTTVTVRLEGNSDTLRQLNAADIVVTPNYNAVTGPGEYEIPLRVSQTGSYSVVEISPSSVVVQFEKIQTKSVPVVATADAVVAAEGYYKGTLTTAQTAVEVTGPENELRRIVSALAEVPVEEERSETLRYTATLKLLDENGDEVVNDLVTLEIPEIEVTVPILERREVPIVPIFSGVPTGFDTEWLKSLMTLSLETLDVAGSATEMEQFTQCEIGPIDLSAFDIEGAYAPFPIELPGSITSLEDIKQVTVSFDTEELATQSFTVAAENIEVIHAAENLEITPVQSRGANVQLVGPVDVLESLLPENIIVQVDAFGVTATESGQQTIRARVLVGSSHQVFAIGSYEVLCDIEVG